MAELNPPPGGEGRSPRRNVLIMSVAFCLLFSSFNTAGIFAGSGKMGVLGPISLGLLYTSFSLCGFVSPLFCERWGPGWTMAVGSVCYLIYTASLAYLFAPIIIFTSILLGFGAALLWSGQGTYLSANSAAQKYASGGEGEDGSSFPGLFWGGFCLNTIFGPLMSWGFLKLWPSDLKGKDREGAWDPILSPMLLLLSALVVPATLLLFTLRHPVETPEEIIAEEEYDEGDMDCDLFDPPSPEKVKAQVEEEDPFDAENVAIDLGDPMEPSENLEEPEQPKLDEKGMRKLRKKGMRRRSQNPNQSWGFSRVGGEFRRTVALMLTRKVLYLGPMMFYTGISVTFWSAWFPRQINEKLVGFVMALFGTSSAFIGLSGGLKELTFKQRSSVQGVCVTTAIFCIIQGTQTLVKQCESVGVNLPCSENLMDQPLFLVAALALGIADCVVQTSMLAILSSNFADQSSTAFAVFRVYQATALGLAFAVTPFLGDLKQVATGPVLWLECGVFAFGLVCSIIGVHKFNMSVHRATTEE